MSRTAIKPLPEQAEMEVLTPDSTGVSVVAQVSSSPGIVLLDREKFDVFYEGLRAKAPTDVDVSTKKGRDELRSFAAEVRSQKAAIDKARLGMTKQWRDMTAQANDAGKEIEQRLESLAVEVRQPLTEWEEAEKARADRCEAVITGLRNAAVVTMEDTAADVRARGKEVWATDIGDDFGDMAEEAKAVKASTVATLQSALERLTKEEADRAELELLRAAQAEREAREAAEREAAEQAERERLAAEEQERRRVAAEEAEAQRIRDAEARAAEAAREEAARVAREAEEQREREHEAALAEERAAREEVERINREERDRRAAEEAEAARQAEEEARRAKNRAHRAQIMGEAKLSIMAAGGEGEHPITEAAAVAIVRAIVAGSIPHVTLAF